MLPLWSVSTRCPAGYQSSLEHTVSISLAWSHQAVRVALPLPDPNTVNDNSVTGYRADSDLPKLPVSTNCFTSSSSALSTCGQMPYTSSSAMFRYPLCRSRHRPRMRTSPRVACRATRRDTGSLSPSPTLSCSTARSIHPTVPLHGGCRGGTMSWETPT